MRGLAPKQGEATLIPNTMEINDINNFVPPGPVYASRYPALLNFSLRTSADAYALRMRHPATHMASSVGKFRRCSLTFTSFPGFRARKKLLVGKASCKMSVHIHLDAAVSSAKHFWHPRSLDPPLIGSETSKFIIPILKLMFIQNKDRARGNRVVQAHRCILIYN